MWFILYKLFKIYFIIRATVCIATALQRLQATKNRQQEHNCVETNNIARPDITIWYAFAVLSVSSRVKWRLHCEVSQRSNFEINETKIREIHTEKANEKRLIHQLNNLARSEGIRQLIYLTCEDLLMLFFTETLTIVMLLKSWCWRLKVDNIFDMLVSAISNK